MQGKTPKEAEKKVGPELIKKCKGTKSCVVKKEIMFDDYKHTLMSGEGKFNKQRGFRSDKHLIQTIEMTKQSLNNFDSKRYWLNNIESIPFGHYKIKQWQKEEALKRSTLKMENLTL